MKTNTTRNQLIRRAPLAIALGLVLASPVAFAAGPQGGTFRLPGSLTSGNIDQSNPNATQVNLTTPGAASVGVAVIDWGTFNVDAGSSVNFNNNTGTGQAVINVDLQGAATQINGQINNTGAQTSVLVVNPNGISIGSGAQITTSGAFLAAAGSVDTSNPGQVSISLSQAPLVVDEAAQISAGAGAGATDFTFGVPGVSLRSDGTPATLPVAWTGQDTQHTIQVNSGIGEFQLNAGWRTEGGNPNTFQEGRSRYNLAGSQENFVSTNGANFDGVGLTNTGSGILHFDATGTTVRNANIQGNGEVRIAAGGLDNVYVNPGADHQLQVDVTGTISNSSLGDAEIGAQHAGVYVTADRIENSYVNAGRGGASTGAAPVSVQAREVNNLQLVSKNGAIRLFGFDVADGVVGRAENDRDGNRQSMSLEGNAGSTLRNVNIEPAITGVSDTFVSMDAHTLENITTNTETQVNIQQGGSLNGANFNGNSPVFISSPESAQISNVNVGQATVFATNLGPGSTVTDIQVNAANIDINGGLWGTNARVNQTDANGGANVYVEGINGASFTWSAPFYLESSGSIINPILYGTNDFAIVAPLLQGNNGSINAMPLDMTDPNARVSGQFYLGRLEGSMISVVGDLYMEVDSIGAFNGQQSGATVYRGNLTVRVRSADGSIWTVRGGRLDIVAQENLDNTSILLTGSAGGTVSADSISGGNFTYDQPRVDDPGFEPVPAPIGNGEFVVNARTIEGANMTAIDSDFTINASDAIRNSTVFAYYLRGTAAQTNLTINAPMVDRVNANGAGSNFGSLAINADTTQNSNLNGTSVAINGRQLLNSFVRAFDGQLEAILSGQISTSTFQVSNGNANIQGGQIVNSRGYFNSSTVAVGAASIDGLSINGSAGDLSIEAGSANNIAINTTGTNVDLTATSADNVQGSDLGNTILNIGTASNISIFGASSIQVNGGDWATATLISNGDLRLDLASLSGGELTAANTATLAVGDLSGTTVNAQNVVLDADRVSGSTVVATNNVSGRAGVVDNSTIDAQNISLTVAEVRNASVLQAVQNLSLTGGTIVIRDSQLLADVLRIQASGDLTVDGASTLDAVSRVALAATGKLGIGEAGGNVLITSERITGDADRIVIGDNAALIVRTPSDSTGSDRIQINGDATYTGDGNQQATSGNFYAFGFSWTIIGDQVVLLDPPKNGQVEGEAGITLTARNGVEVNGGSLFAGPGQEDPPVVEPPCTVDCTPEPPEPIVPPSVRVQTVLADDVDSARYTDAVLLVPAKLGRRQGGVEE